MNKKTLVIGASVNPMRYSNSAVISLQRFGYEVVALAKRSGRIGDIHIQIQFPENELIHTITLYIGPKHQPEYYERIIDLKPRRVIFNPGTENPDFLRKLEASGIEALEDCTLEMLNADRY